MNKRFSLNVNGASHTVDVDPDMPLLYALRDDLTMNNPHFGCGLAQCGACSVLLDGKEIRSCVTPVAAVSGKAITTLEGMPALYAKSRGTTASSPAPVTECFTSSQRPVGSAASRFSTRPADRSSTTVTQAPSATNRSTRCEPMNPAPPQTRTCNAQSLRTRPRGCGHRWKERAPGYREVRARCRVSAKTRRGRG